ncbi:hypothetical protein FA95DRAFT_1396475 [Auriscalpium vulgare]|uniref:Uncharacterized protein n=1 Tax=Auriscalpium vulgare TaxID=40419 RepID=A0ACB8RQM6_9AGAM|nr:hypothetical protein FA95DRAFT_1396475 [Auriscalpium vulgare]
MPVSGYAIGNLMKGRKCILEDCRLRTTFCDITTHDVNRRAQHGPHVMRKTWAALGIAHNPLIVVPAASDDGINVGGERSRSGALNVEPSIHRVSFEIHLSSGFPVGNARGWRKRWGRRKASRMRLEAIHGHAPQIRACRHIWAWALGLYRVTVRIR